MQGVQGKIVYMTGDFDVRRSVFGGKEGFTVWENGPSCAVLVATIAYAGDCGLSRAIAEANRRCHSKQTKR